MKRTFYAAAVLAAAYAIDVAGQASPSEGYVKAVEGLNAAVEKKDKEAYGRFVTDDAVWIDLAGRVLNRSGIVAGLNALSPKRDIRAYPSGAVIVGTRADGLVRFLQLWVQRGNQWQLAAHQGRPIGDEPVPAATAPSAPMPPNSGTAAEIKAIEQAIAALAAGNSKGDAKNFAASVTDGFVAISNTGEVVSKQQRIAEIQKNGPPPNSPASWLETSTRVYGDLAVTNRANKTNRQMIVHVKQGGKWLRAGIITTPIATGKPTGR